MNACSINILSEKMLHDVIYNLPNFLKIFFELFF